MKTELLDFVESKSLKENVPHFEIGDVVDVHVKIVEGAKERIFVWITGYSFGDGCSLNNFWSAEPINNANIHSLTKQFVNRWFGLVFGNKYSNPHDISFVDNKDARALIYNREIQIKRNRARLANSRAQELWGGASGDAQLDYRWKTAKRFIADIIKGLKS